MTRAVIALGANLGDARAALVGAVQALAATPQLRVVAESSIYRTAPIGGPEQPDYLNAVVIVETELSPGALLAVCQGIERQWDRTREVRWGPRTLDLDIIAFGDVVSDDPVLTLPHPRANQRAFVLAPWLEADPAAVLPGQGTVAGLLEQVGHQGVELA